MKCLVYVLQMNGGFGQITNEMRGVNFKANNKIFQNNPAVRYKVATLLENCRICMRGSCNTSTYFQCPPMDVVHYLSGEWQ